MTITAPTTDHRPHRDQPLIQGGILHVGGAPAKYDEVFAEVRAFFEVPRNTQLTIVVNQPALTLTFRRALFRQTDPYGYVNCACNDALLSLFPRSTDAATSTQQS